MIFCISQYSHKANIYYELTKTHNKETKHYWNKLLNHKDILSVSQKSKWTINQDAKDLY